MTKKQLLERYESLADEHGFHIQGIDQNSNKATIRQGIECLEATAEEMDFFFRVFAYRWENLAQVIAKNGDFKQHHHNRFYVWESAQSILLPDERK